jgi:hypothetical protein
MITLMNMIVLLSIVVPIIWIPAIMKFNKLENDLWESK